MFDKYQKSPNLDTADELLKSLNNSRKEKWNELMENMNFTHSSRSCWCLVKLKTRNNSIHKLAATS
jgi:hypothetical protein